MFTCICAVLYLKFKNYYCILELLPDIFSLGELELRFNALPIVLVVPYQIIFNILNYNCILELLPGILSALGELELPFNALLIVLVAPYQISNLR